MTPHAYDRDRKLSLRNTQTLVVETGWCRVTAHTFFHCAFFAGLVRFSQATARNILFARKPLLSPETTIHSRVTFSDLHTFYPSTDWPILGCALWHLFSAVYPIIHREKNSSDDTYSSGDYQSHVSPCYESSDT